MYLIIWFLCGLPVCVCEPCIGGGAGGGWRVFMEEKLMGLFVYI